MKIISWNVNGLRAIVKKNFSESAAGLKADIICLQETKADIQQVTEALENIDGYHIYANESKTKKGYSGTAIMTKIKPLSVQYDMSVPQHDEEGRVIALEFPEYYLVNVYVPNSGQGLVRLDYRQQWDRDFLAYLKDLEKKKPIIVCGDFNVAHEPIDIARPKSNYNKTAGYTQAEIDGFDRFVNSELVDIFRDQHPGEIAYTWWSFRANARAKNIGWRIDYFLVSNSLKPEIKESFILPQIDGSDHCPLGIIL